MVERKHSWVEIAWLGLLTLAVIALLFGSHTEKLVPYKEYKVYGDSGYAGFVNYSNGSITYYECNKYDVCEYFDLEVKK